MELQDIKIGTPVTYWGIIKTNGEKFNPVASKILSEPWKLGHGEWVCKVYGISGGVSIRHLDLRTPTNSTDPLTQSRIMKATEGLNLEEGI